VHIRLEMSQAVNRPRGGAVAGSSAKGLVSDSNYEVRYVEEIDGSGGVLRVQRREHDAAGRPGVYVDKADVVLADRNA